MGCWPPKMEPLNFAVAGAAVVVAAVVPEVDMPHPVRAVVAASSAMPQSIAGADAFLLEMR